MAEPFVKTVQKVDAILYHLGYKDGKDYKWSDRDHVLTFTSDEVRKAVATKIPSELIHAQYPKTIELEDKGFTDSRSVYRVKDTNGLIHRVVARNSDEAVKKVKDSKFSDDSIQETIKKVGVWAGNNRRRLLGKPVEQALRIYETENGIKFSNQVQRELIKTFMRMNGDWK